jgi:GTP pyrophosphokinase
MVKEVDQCYLMLGNIHSLYRPVNEKFKDYICNPKTNMYQSLHSTVYGPDERLVQMQIRTFEMDKTASGGIATYWDIHKGNARYIMQERLKEEYQFYTSLKEIDKNFSDNEEFINRVKSELFQGEIYVITTDGEVKALPIGSSPIDFAYKVHTEVGNHMVGAYVNDNLVPFDYELQNQDHVKIITDDNSSGPSLDWLNTVKTSLARRKIKEYYRK